MIVVISILFFICGLLLGSFFNVATIRYNPETDSLMSFKTINGRSRCDGCGRTLCWKELFPLFSFLFLKGKCATCQNKISLQHPIIEFISGIIFAGVPLFVNHFFGFSNDLFYSFESPWWHYAFSAFWIFIFYLFLIIVVIDLKHYIIPNGLNLLLGLFGVLYSLFLFFVRDEIPLFYDSFLRHYAMVFSPFQNIIYSHLFGFFIGGLFFVLLVLFTLGRGIGLGDVKLAFALGVLLGWPDIGLTMMLSFMIGGLISGSFVIFKMKHLKEKVPFAPFFIAGTIVTIFFGHTLLKLYFSIFNL